MDLGHLGALADVAARGDHCPRQGMRQPHRMHRRTVRCAQAGDHSGGIDDRLRLVAVEPPIVVVAEPEPAQLVEFVPQSVSLGNVARNRDRAARVKDLRRTVLVDEPADLANGVVHGLHHALGGRLAVPLGDLGEADRQQRRAPPAVAPAGPEADRLTLEHHHPQTRVGLQQVPRGPQPGEARPDDRHIDGRPGR